MTHWKKLHNPDYLGAYAFQPEQEIIATIKYVQQEKVTGSDGKKEECTVAHFVENIKPLILNVTNSKTIEKIHKTPFIEEWVGKKIQLYVEKIKAFGDYVEAVRIRSRVPEESKPEPIICMECGEAVAGIKTKDNTISPIQVASMTKAKYGKVLCSPCAVKAKAVMEAESAEPVKEENSDE